MSTTYPSDLSDTEWEYLQRHLPPLARRGRPRTHSPRRILDAIFYVLRTGCAWRDLPSNCPNLWRVGPGEEDRAQGRRLTEIVLDGIRSKPER
jgi:transposase